MCVLWSRHHTHGPAFLYLSGALAGTCLLSGTGGPCVKTHCRAGACPQLNFTQPWNMCQRRWTWTRKRGSREASPRARGGVAEQVSSPRGGKGAPPQGGGRPRQFQPNRGPRQAAPSQGSRSKEESRGRSGTSSDVLLHKVAKALIVQSDYLSRLQSDHTVIFTLRNGDGPQLMVPLLHEVAANWRDQRSRAKSPSPSSKLCSST